jgi:hypothetical protein
VKLVLVKKHRANIMIASHNQKSIENTIDLMREMNIDPTTGGVYFGQLLGMSCLSRLICLMRISSCVDGEI